MNRNSPYPFSVYLLREASQVGWIRAIGASANGVRALLEANLSGWFYATGGCREGVDKGGFHAIGDIGGIDEQP